MDDVEINIIKNNKIVIGPLKGYNKDPFFVLSMQSFDVLKLLFKHNVSRGDEIEIIKDGVKQRRIIFGITQDDLSGIEFISPLVVNNKKPDGYPSMSHASQKELVELRPGTKIIGGRGSGFYDDYGVILKAEWTGGDISKWEDWVFYVLGHNAIFGEIYPQWVLFDQIGFGLSEPEYIQKFHQYDNDTLNQLLQNGEKEILEYFHHNPNKVTELTPKNFELFVSSIYKNNGFIVEPIGSWNQADGGVDVIAVSKTLDEDIRLAIQCKVSKNKISAKPIRELSGVLDIFKAHKGVVATNSTFTKNAHEEVEAHFWKVTLEDINSINVKLAGIFSPEFKESINKHKNNYK